MSHLQCALNKTSKGSLGLPTPSVCHPCNLRPLNKTSKGSPGLPTPSVCHLYKLRPLNKTSKRNTGLPAPLCHPCYFRPPNKTSKGIPGLHTPSVCHLCNVLLTKQVRVVHVCLHLLCVTVAIKGSFPLPPEPYALQVGIHAG